MHKPIVWRWGSLRTRLLALMLLATLPAFLGLAYGFSVERRNAEAAMEDEAVRVARLAAQAQADFVIAAQEILIPLAADINAQPGDPPLCRRFYQRLIENESKTYFKYSNIGVVNPQGRIYCAVRSVTGGVDVNARAFFVQAHHLPPRLTIDNYLFDDDVDGAFVYLGYPVLGATGQVRAVVFIVLDVNWLNDLYTAKTVPADSVFSILDHAGTVLVRQPPMKDAIGVAALTPETLDALHTRADTLIITQDDADGVRRLHVLTPLDPTSTTSAYVQISTPVQVVYAEAQNVLWWAVAVLGLLLILAYGIVAFGSDWLVLREVNHLLQTARQIEQGDLTPRVQAPFKNIEFEQVAHALNDMARALLHREQQQRYAEQALQLQTQRAETLLRIAARLNAQLDLPTVLQCVCEETAQALHVPMAAVALWVPAHDKFAVVARSKPVNTPPLDLPGWPRQRYEEFFQRLGPAVTVPDVEQFPSLHAIAAAGYRSVLAVPLWHQTSLMGLISAASVHTVRVFTADEKALLLGIADQGMQAIANAQLLAEIRQRSSELEALYEITFNFASPLNVAAFLEQLTQRACHLLAARAGALWLYEAACAELVVTVTVGEAPPPGTRVQVGDDSVGGVAQTRQPRLINEQLTAPEPGPPSLRASVVVPLLYSGDLLGVLSMNNAANAPRPYSAQDARLLSLIAGQAASALYNHRLLVNEQQARQTAETLQAANLALTQILDLDAVLQTLLMHLRQLVPYDTGHILLLGGDNQLALRARAGYHERGLPEPALGPVANTDLAPMTRQVLTEQHSILIHDTEVYPEWCACGLSAHAKSWLGIPLVLGEEVLGLYSMDKFEPAFFTERHRQLAEAMAYQAAAAIQNARLYEIVRAGQEQLRHLAQKIVMTQEEERLRLSRELHDEAGQALVGLKLELGIIAEALPWVDPDVERRLQRALVTIEETMQRLRQVTRDLRPAALDTVGLHRVLEDMCLDYADRTRLAVNYTGGEVSGLSNIASIGLYRVAQEALTNVVKHAQARTVCITLSHTADSLQLSVQDDGQGFAVATVLTSSVLPGIGLTGMHERMQLMGGELEVDSKPGAGTRVVARVSRQK